MKCNQCGTENSDGVSFCSHCGSALESGATVTAPVSNDGTTVSATVGPNGPAAQVSKPIKNKGLTIALVAIIAVAIIGAIVWLVVRSVGGGQTVISCSKDGKALTSTARITAKGDNVSKVEYTYVIDETVDEDDLTSSEAQDVMMVAFLSLAMANVDEPGIKFETSEKSTITTISLTLDVDKMSKESKEEYFDDGATVSIKEAQESLEEQGMTCKKK